MKVDSLFKIIDADFYTGVPDSQLKALCNYLMDKYSISAQHHIIAANEGNSVAIAAGYYLATGKIPVVYMQNSGEGNIVNPVASLLNKEVYAIPMIFIVGWRGEPGVHDEPQHIFQGQITTTLLSDLDIESFVIGPETEEEEVERQMKKFKLLLKAGKQVAFVIRKGALTDAPIVDYSNKNVMSREEAIRHIINFSANDPIISTTGKASRELFELRTETDTTHAMDFLTVGSMGHASSIALGVALSKPDHKVWCIDGDGAALMHLGAIAVIGSNRPQNLVHIVINNGAHETVGGMPTVVQSMDMVGIARSCGYPVAVSVDTYEKLDKALSEVKENKKLSFIEVKCSIGSREDLGRPTTSAIENKESFMKYLQIY